MLRQLYGCIVLIVVFTCTTIMLLLSVGQSPSEVGFQVRTIYFPWFVNETILYTSQYVYVMSLLSFIFFFTCTNFDWVPSIVASWLKASPG